MDRTADDTLTKEPWGFTQDEATLDLAWRRFMDEGIERFPAPHPIFELGIKQGLRPHEISHLFDIAITAYRESRER